MTLPSRRQQHYTEQEFAALVKASDKRLELREGEVFDRSYSSLRHRDIVRNLADALRRRNDLWVETIDVGLSASLALNLPGKSRCC